MYWTLKVRRIDDKLLREGPLLCFLFLRSSMTQSLARQIAKEMKQDGGHKLAAVCTSQSQRSS